MREGPRASFNNLSVSVRISRDGNVCPRNGVDNTRTYVEADNNLLKFEETNANIAKTTSEIGQLVKLLHQSEVHVTDAVHLNLRVMRCRI